MTHNYFYLLKTDSQISKNTQNIQNLFCCFLRKIENRYFLFFFSILNHRRCLAQWPPRILKIWLASVLQLLKFGLVSPLAYANVIITGSLRSKTGAWPPSPAYSRASSGHGPMPAQYMPERLSFYFGKFRPSDCSQHWQEVILPIFLLAIGQ